MLFTISKFRVLESNLFINSPILLGIIKSFIELEIILNRMNNVKKIYIF